MPEVLLEVLAAGRAELGFLFGHAGSDGLLVGDELTAQTQRVRGAVRAFLGGAAGHAGRGEARSEKKSGKSGRNSLDHGDLLILVCLG